MDESRFGLMSIQRRCLVARGVKPVVPYQHRFQNFYLFGAYAPGDGDHFTLELPYCNADCFQLYLDELSAHRPDEMKALILDNGAFHKAARLVVPKNIVLHFCRLTLQNSTRQSKSGATSRTAWPTPPSQPWMIWHNRWHRSSDNSLRKSSAQSLDGNYTLNAPFSCLNGITLIRAVSICACPHTAKLAKRQTFSIIRNTLIGILMEGLAA